MFIEEKYLITPNSTGAAAGNTDSTISILVCKHCKREFMVPNDVADKLTVKDVCAAPECVDAHVKGIANATVAEIKNKAAGDIAGDIQKVLGK